MNIALKKSLGTLAVSLVAAIAAQAQTVIYTFSDSTSQGWYNSGFSSTTPSTVVNIGGLNYINLHVGGFQVANVTSSSSTLPDFASTMAAAAANPAAYALTYSYYVDTSGWTGASYLQLGAFVNTGSGYYHQDFGLPNEVQLSGDQMASGQIFQGTITVPFTTAGFAMPAGETFFRLGLIENSDGQGSVGFTSIGIIAVPEPSTLALAGLGFAGLIALRRRQA